MLRPVLLVVLLLSTILTFGDFTLPYVLTNCAPYNSTCVLSTWAFQIGVNGGYIGIGAAISLLLFPLLSISVAGRPTRRRRRALIATARQPRNHPRPPALAPPRASPRALP